MIRAKGGRPVSLWPRDRRKSEMDNQSRIPIWFVDVFEEALRYTPEGPYWDILDQLAVVNGKVVIAGTGEDTNT